MTEPVESPEHVEQGPRRAVAAVGPKLRVTVCEIDATKLDAAWSALIAHFSAEPSDVLLLPELAFGPPFFTAPVFDADVWRSVVAAHDERIARLAELGVPCVIGTRPVDTAPVDTAPFDTAPVDTAPVGTAPVGTAPVNARGGAAAPARHNVGFVWTAARGAVPLHAKAFLPEEPGAHEATWFAAGSTGALPAPRAPFVLDGTGAACALSICTELWHLPSIASFAAAGVDVVMTPRATAHATRNKWLALGRTAAVSAGAWGLSSNRVDAGGVGGGCGWAFHPDGALVAITDAQHPIATVDVDLAVSRAAKSTYPRSVFRAP